MARVKVAIDIDGSGLEEDPISKGKRVSISAALGSQREQETTKVVDRWLTIEEGENGRGCPKLVAGVGLMAAGMNGDGGG